MTSRFWVVGAGLLLLLSAGLVGCQTSPDAIGGTAELLPGTASVVAEASSDPVVPKSTATPAELPASVSHKFSGFTDDGDPFLGNPDAPVLIEEFSSYQCPFCALYFRETYARLTTTYADTGQIQYVFRDFPLPDQQQAVLAAEAANCVGEIAGAEAFWQMHDVLFAQQNVWAGRDNAIDIIERYVVQMGVDTVAFDQCIDSPATRAEIEADAAEGRQRGVSGTPTFFINGQLVVGAQPFEMFANIVDPLVKGNAGAMGAAQTPTAPFPTPTPAVVLPVDAVRTLGEPDAPVTIVEFSDYQCPFCLRYFNETLPQIKANLIDTGRVRYEFKDFPLASLHPQAPQAHAAARCAGEQAAYWEMHDALFARQSEWSAMDDPAPLLKELATGLGLDTTLFDSCLDSAKWASSIESEVNEGLSLDVSGTPTFFINGFPVVGAREYALFEYAVQLAEQGTLGDVYQPVE